MSVSDSDSASHIAGGTYPANLQVQAGSLYVVATPIGHLGDLSHRAESTLRQVDCIAAEDTRVTQTLLRYLGLRKPLIAAHEHNETAAGEAVVARLHKGESVALVSDAGTPGISDPGQKLVAAVRAAGCPIVPVPGANAAMSVLSVAGLPRLEHWWFEGFLPATSKARAERLRKLLTRSEPFVLYESPHRIEALAALLDTEAQRAVVVGRELTKRFEEIALVPGGALSAWLADTPQRTRGEFVLLVAAPEPDKEQTPEVVLPDKVSVDLAALLALAGSALPASQAAKWVAQHTGLDRQKLFEAINCLPKRA